MMKTNMKKRLLSLLLTLVMILGMIPATTLTANAATLPEITGLHRGVLTDGEDPRFLYWDTTANVEKYEVKCYLNDSLVKTTLVDGTDNKELWITMPKNYGYWADNLDVPSGNYKFELTAGYMYGDVFVPNSADSTATVTFSSSGQKYGQPPFSTIPSITREPGSEIILSLLEKIFSDFEKKPSIYLIDAPDWLQLSNGVLTGIVPANAQEGTIQIKIGAPATNNIDGYIALLDINIKGDETGGGVNWYEITEVWIQDKEVTPEYWDLWTKKQNMWYTKIVYLDLDGSVKTATGDAIYDFMSPMVPGFLYNAETGNVVGDNTVIQIGKYQYRYELDTISAVDLMIKPTVYLSRDAKVYVGNKQIETQTSGSAISLVYGLWAYNDVHYIYDVKPEINSVTVNGQSVADEGTFTTNNKNVTIKTTYDSELSDALTAYGCKVEHLSDWYLNGQHIGVAKATPVDQGDGTSTKTHTRPLNDGDVLKVYGRLEVIWPDGSRDIVDEHTVTAMYVDADFESIYPVPTSTELTNKYTDLGTMNLGSSATNIDFKAFPKKLSAAAISDGWTTGRSISVTRDGVEIYNRTYADNELFGWNLKDNIDEGGTYLITLRVFAQKGEQIVEKTHKFRVFVKGSTIKTITLEGVATPVIGKSPSTIDTVKSNTAGVVVKKVIWNYWTSEMGGNWLVMPSGSKFEAGKRYAVEIELQTADGYSFTANKSDMTVYINGEVARKSINYSSNKFSAELEFESISTPAFTSQPVGGKVSYGGKMTVSWQTNFTPCKIIVGEYNSLNQVVNQVEYSNTTTSVELPANEYGYVVIAYYNNANAKYSNKITITETAPAFTLQPADGVSLGGAYAEVTWETNFVPVKLQVLKYSQGYCTGSQNLDVNATTASVKAGDEYCIIRAYYSDSNYVDSDKFTITDIAYYNAWFYVDDTVFDKVMVLEGDYVARPADPVKDGYTFLGWYTDDGEKYNFAAPVTDDVHLTAKFEESAASNILKGDLNDDGSVDNLDVEYLLWHTLFPEEYTLNQDGDFTGDGSVDNLDVEYLLWHTLFPEEYPL